MSVLEIRLENCSTAKGFVYGEVKTDRRKLQDAFDQVIGSTRRNAPQGR